MKLNLNFLLAFALLSVSAFADTVDNASDEPTDIVGDPSSSASLRGVATDPEHRDLGTAESVEYAYEESSNCNFWRGCRDYVTTEYRWCVQGINPFEDVYRSDKWDKTRLKKIGNKKDNTPCADRTDIGTGSCTRDHWAMFKYMYKC